MTLEKVLETYHTSEGVVTKVRKAERERIGRKIRYSIIWKLNDVVCWNGKADIKHLI